VRGFSGVRHGVRRLGSTSRTPLPPRRYPGRQRGGYPADRSGGRVAGEGRGFELRIPEIGPEVAPGLPREVCRRRRSPGSNAKTPVFIGRNRIGAGRLELPTSWSQTRRATNCATPRGRPRPRTPAPVSLPARHDRPTRSPRAAARRRAGGWPRGPRSPGVNRATRGGGAPSPPACRVTRRTGRRAVGTRRDR